MSTSSNRSRVRRATLVTLAVIAVAAAVALIGARIAGVQLLEVRGGSMQPTIADRSLLVTVPAIAADVTAGDVVSILDDQGRRVTHRVVAVDAAGSVTTRGDANTIADPQPYTGDRLDLVVAAVPGAGPATRLLGAPMTVLAVALVTVAVLDTAAAVARTRRGDLVHQVVAP